MTHGTLGLVVAGLALLVVGAEGFVRGASRLATALGIPPLVVGLTVVALGTSSAELAVSVMAALRHQSDLAFGNVVGSSICNVLLILGLAALVTPLKVERALIRRDAPVMLGSGFLMAVLAFDGVVSVRDGAGMLVLLVAYIGYTVRSERRNADPEEAGPGGSLLGAVGITVVGLGALVLGSDWLVKGAVVVARAFGVGELVIGLTVVSVGTSLPEIATSMLAARKGEGEIAVGNVVGSNIFNVLFVLGVTAVAAPDGVPVAPGALYFDVPIMLAAGTACLPIMFTNHAIDRWEGGLLLLHYTAYVAYLVLDAQGHAQLEAFSWVMVLFVLPLTALALGVTTWRAVTRGTRRLG